MLRTILSIGKNAIEFFTGHFKRKIILITILILTFIVVLVVAVIYKVDIPVQMNNAIVSDSKEVRYVSERLDTAISNYDWFIGTITMNDALQSILKQSYTNSLEEKLLNFDLEQTLGSATVLSSDKFGHIFLYDTRKLRSMVLNNMDYDRAYLELDPSRYNSEGNVRWKVEDGQLYIHRAIRDRDSLGLIGYLTISVSENFLQDLLRTADTRYTFVYNENGQLVIRNHHDPQLPVNRVSLMADRFDEGPQIVSLEPFGEMLLTTHRSQFSLWTTVSLIPLSQVTEGPRKLAQWIIGIGAVGIMLGTVIIWISANRMIQPLKELSRAMAYVKQDRFDLQVDIRRKDEFGQLGQSFNRMMKKIDHLISEVYRKELSRKEAEFKALKAQINPHFLYNTLETIRSLAEFGEDDKVEMVAVSLGKLLKASISNKKDVIPVREELAYIDAYLAIQNTRFQNKVDVITHVDEAILERTIPRFILQPLIENAYVHGLENKVGKGQLIIKGVRLQDDTIAFNIIDDGVGMDEHQLAELFKGPRTEESVERKGTGSGILNVHNRLQMLYGEEYGLRIVSSPLIGTNIEMRIPLSKEG